MAAPFLSISLSGGQSVQIDAYQVKRASPQVARPVGKLVGGRKVTAKFSDPTWDFGIRIRRIAPADATLLRGAVGTTVNLTANDDAVAAGLFPFAQIWQSATFAASLLDMRVARIYDDQRQGDEWNLSLQTSETLINASLSPPRSVRVRSRTQDEISIAWRAPATDGGSPITGYQVRIDGGGSVDVGLALEWTFSRLAPGSRHTMEVRAVTAVGESDWVSVIADTAVLLTPGAVLNLMAAAGDTYVDLEWDPPFSAGSGVDGYEWQYEVTGSSTPWVRVDATSVRVGGLTDGVQYRFRVRAVGPGGEGPATGISVTPAVAPGAVQNLMATPGDTHVDLAWEAPRAIGGGVNYYEWQYQITGMTSTAWVRVDATSVRVGGLTDGVNYRFRVRAVGPGGEGPAVGITETPAVAPGPVRALSPLAGDEEVVLSWQAPNTGGEVSRYEWMYELLGVSTPWVSVGLARQAVVDGLSNDEAYRFRVRAVGPGGEGPGSAVTAVPTSSAEQATVPTNVRATSVSSAFFTVLWDPPTTFGDGDFVRYEARLDGSAWVDRGGMENFTPTLVLDLTLMPGVTYVAQIRAVTTDGNGAIASLDVTTIVGVVAPGAPTDLNVVSSDSQLALTWAAPDDNGGAVIDRYEVQIDSGGWIAPDSDSSHVFRGLDNGTTYTLEVRAVNRIGEGPAAEIDAAPVFLLLPPGAVRNLMATAGDTHVDLAWEAPLDVGNGVDYYEWQHETGGVSTAWVRVDATSVRVGSLTDGVSYRFRVRAVGPGGEGPAEGITESPVEAPGNVRRLRAAAGDEEVVLTWLAPNTGGVVVGYEWSFRISGALMYSVWMQIGIVLTVTADDLTNGTAYDFRVRATGQSDVPGPEREISETPMGTGTPATVPTNLRATSISTVFFNVLWDPPDDLGTGGLDRYEARIDGGAWVDRGTFESFPPSQHGTVLEPNTAYTVDVRAVTSVGNGAVASITVMTLVEVVEPGPPTGLSVVAADSQITLLWSAPLDNGGAPIDRYEVQIDSGGWIAPDSDSSHVFRSLQNGTTYTLEVRAVNRIGEGPAAEIDAAPFITLAPPGPVRNLMATAGDTHVDLQWSRPSDVGSGVNYYEWQHEAGGVTTAWVRVDATSVRVGGLTDGVQYRFRVRAVGAGGEGPAVGITETPVEAPGVPRSFMATPGNTFVDLQWTVPSDVGSGVDGYEWQYEVDGATSQWVAESGTSVRATGLTNGSAHRFRVRAQSSGVTGPIAAVSETPVSPDQTSTAPRNLRRTARTLTTITIGWDAPSDLGSDPLIRYQVSFNRGAYVTAALNTTHTQVSLQQGQSYNFRVRAVTAAGNGAVASVDATTASSASAPRNLTASRTTVSSITVVWDPPTTFGSGTFSRYEARIGGGAWINRGGMENETFTGLSSGTTYTIQARAVTSVGNGAAASVSIQTYRLATAPTNLMVQSVSQSRITVTWDPPSTFGTGTFTRYEARIDGGSWINRGGMENESFLGLMAGTLHNIQARAVTSHGNGAVASIGASTTSARDSKEFPSMTRFTSGSQATGAVGFLNSAALQTSPWEIPPQIVEDARSQYLLLVIFTIGTGTGVAAGNVELQFTPGGDLDAAQLSGIGFVFEAAGESITINPVGGGDDTSHVYTWQPDDDEATYGSLNGIAAVIAFARAVYDASTAIGVMTLNYPT